MSRYFKCVLLNKQGDVRNCITSLQLYPDTGILEGSIKDITKRKKAEEELNKIMHQLETFNRISVNRILRMVELKKEINELLEKAGEPNKYL